MFYRLGAPLARLRERWHGRKTIWVSRFYIVVGVLLAVKDVMDANGFSVATYLPEWMTSAAYWPFVLVGTGLLFEGLRRISYTAAFTARCDEDDRHAG